MREYQALADGTVSLWFERSVTAPWGLFGGAAGNGPDVVLDPRTPNERHILKANGLKVKAGTIIRCAVSGGGGYGDPADRDPAAIAADLADEMITPEYAREHHGWTG